MIHRQGACHASARAWHRRSFQSRGRPKPYSIKNAKSVQKLPVLHHIVRKSATEMTSGRRWPVKAEIRPVRRRPGPALTSRIATAAIAKPQRSGHGSGNAKEAAANWARLDYRGHQVGGGASRRLVPGRGRFGPPAGLFNKGDMGIREIEGSCHDIARHPLIPDHLPIS